MPIIITTGTMTDRGWEEEEEMTDDEKKAKKDGATGTSRTEIKNMTEGRSTMKELAATKAGDGAVPEDTALLIKQSAAATTLYITTTSSFNYISIYILIKIPAINQIFLITTRHSAGLREYLSDCLKKKRRTSCLVDPGGDA